MTATSGVPSQNAPSPAASGGEQATVRIPSIQVLPQSHPTLNVGDILRFFVRANPETGPGTLYFQGQLIKTPLPPHIQAGDRLVARLEQSGEQVVFKILEHIKGSHTSSGHLGSNDVSSGLLSRVEQGRSPFEQLVQKVEMLINHTSALLPQSAESATESPSLSRTPVSLPQITDVAQVKEQVEIILATIGSAELFSDPKAVTQGLSSVVQGNVAHSLREAAEAIRKFITEDKGAKAPGERFITVLQQEISKLLDEALRGIKPEQSAKQFDTLIRVLDDELKQTRHRGDSGKTNLLKLTLTELKMAKEHPQQSMLYIESALERLFNYQGPTEQQGTPQLNPQTAAELQLLAGRLENLAVLQETLTQLNPLMQALGEPALILFPFIFQNMLHHSELSIQPDRKKKEGSGKKSPAESAYQRLQIAIPLPGLGKVDVEVAYRDEEILLRFGVADEKIAAFINEQQSSLRTSLSHAGFNLKEFHAEKILAVEGTYEKAPARKADGGIVA